MRFSSILLLLLAVGCDSPGDDVPAEPVPDSAERGAEPTSQVMYSCESGREIQASYPTDSTAVVEYEGQRLRMTIAVSASGARYVDDRLEWWTEGSGPGLSGTLLRHESDDTSGEIVEQCEQPA